MSPFALMKSSGYLPIYTTVFAAIVAGGTVSFWFSRVRKEMFEIVNKSFMPVVSSVMLGIYAVLFLFSTIFSIVKFDKNAGSFADFAAERIIEELGNRSWLITDGTIDSHLRLMAERKGKKLMLICLQRDGDKAYLDSLAKQVKESNIGGKRNSDLVYSLKLGILPFVQEWISSDDDIGKRLAIYGAPDLFRYNEKLEVIPETWFFGADKSVKVPSDAWTKIKPVFGTPEKWGSYRAWKEKNSIERMRLNIRRHLGFVANNRGVYLEDKGDKDAAFSMYNLVLSEIDADNVCALFNEIEMMRSGYVKAVEQKNRLNKKFNDLKSDPDKRFRLMPLYHYYGYIRNPEIFIRAGISWARSGRPGEAISQIKRAIDFIPTENRNTLMNMLASLYASENDQVKSRSVYEQVLAKDSTNHSALIGLMRLELLNGNREKAIEFLDRAIANSGDDPRAKIEKAMKHMILNETEKAREMLKSFAKSDSMNMQVWSLLSAATIQELQATKDAGKRKKLMDELEKQIIPSMEKKAKTVNDYHLQTSKAYVLMEKGPEFRKEARDAFARAATQRPDIAATSDIILGLDISLNDVVDAERRAREVLRRNRRAPLANYVMGALALQRGSVGEAESFLRRAVESENPPVLALNDYAETLRRRKQFAEAEKYARLAVEKAPNLYVAWETLASTLLDAESSLDEAEKAIEKACQLSTDKSGKIVDVRMLITLARIQKAKGNVKRAISTAQKVRMRYSELSEFEQGEFEEFMKGVR
jgi:tetratricopeptide (TPR) repeat protein